MVGRDSPPVAANLLLSQLYHDARSSRSLWFLVNDRSVKRTGPSSPMPGTFSSRLLKSQHLLAPSILLALGHFSNCSSNHAPFLLIHSTNNGSPELPLLLGDHQTGSDIMIILLDCTFEWNWRIHGELVCHLPKNWSFTTKQRGQVSVKSSHRKVECSRISQKTTTYLNKKPYVKGWEVVVKELKQHRNYKDQVWKFRRLRRKSLERVNKNFPGCCFYRTQTKSVECTVFFQKSFI